jgi:predicted DNA-binding transcriptional regulator AlpA
MAETPDPVRFLNTAELAARYGLDRSTVKRKAMSGEWPHHLITRAIRFSPEDVAAIDEMTARPAQRAKRGAA